MAIVVVIIVVGSSIVNAVTNSIVVVNAHAVGILLLLLHCLLRYWLL